MDTPPHCDTMCVTGWFRVRSTLPLRWTNFCSCCSAITDSVLIFVCRAFNCRILYDHYLPTVILIVILIIIGIPSPTHSFTLGLILPFLQILPTQCCWSKFASRRRGYCYCYCVIVEPFCDGFYSCTGERAINRGSTWWLTNTSCALSTQQPTTLWKQFITGREETVKLLPHKCSEFKKQTVRFTSFFIFYSCWLCMHYRIMAEQRNHWWSIRS